MKVIKRVEPQSISRLVRFNCPCCGSRLEEERDKLGFATHRNEDYYTFVCPVCRKECVVDAGELDPVRSGG